MASYTINIISSPGSLVITKMQQNPRYIERERAQYQHKHRFKYLWVLHDAPLPMASPNLHVMKS